MSEKKLEKHKVVTFLYSLLDESGVVQEQNNSPMSYVHGVDERVFPEVAAVMAQAKIGETREISLSPTQGFGDYDPAKTFTDKIENVPYEFQKIGAEANFQDENGKQLTMTVKSIENGEIFLDGNHPFAGQTMTFRIKVTDIRDATADEMNSGLATDIPDAAVKIH